MGNYCVLYSKKLLCPYKKKTVDTLSVFAFPGTVDAAEDNRIFHQYRMLCLLPEEDGASSPFSDKPHLPVPPDFLHLPDE